jgi:hypothetical protein
MAYIEECLGDEWPKTLYPHGAGREWSTSTHNDAWKEPMGFEVVPAEHLRAIAEVLDGGIPDDRKLATVVRLVNQTLGVLASPSSDLTKEDR